MSATAELAQLEAELQRMLLPKDPDDARPAFVEIRAGTGGDESALFAGDLLRMYTATLTVASFKCEIVSESPQRVGWLQRGGDRIEGHHNGTGAYGAFKFESGGHRRKTCTGHRQTRRPHSHQCLHPCGTGRARRG